MKPELVSFRIDELLRQLEVEFAPLAREKKLELMFVPIGADRAVRPAAAAPAAAEPCLQRHQIHAEGPRAGRLPAPARPSAHRRLRHRPRHSRCRRRRTSSANFIGSIEGAKVARGLGLGLSIVERIARVLDHKLELRSTSAKGSRFSVEVPISAAASEEHDRAAKRRAPIRSGSTASPCSASTTIRKFSTAWRRCSAAGAARSSRPPISQAPNAWSARQE